MNFTVGCRAIARRFTKNSKESNITSRLTKKSKKKKKKSNRYH